MPPHTTDVPYISVNPDEVPRLGSAFTHHSSISEPGYTAYLPNGRSIKWMMYDDFPCTFLKESTFRSYIYGKKLPWLLNTQLQFSTGDNAIEKNSIIPNGDVENGEMKLKDTHGRPMVFKVMGLGILPVVIGHIPFLIQCLVVEDLFPALSEIGGQCQLDAVIHRKVFMESGIAFHASPTFGFYLTTNPTNLRLYREANGLELLRINIDGYCEPIVDKRNITGGIGVFFGKDSCFNLAKPLTGDCRKGRRSDWVRDKASIAAAILGIQATLRIRHIHGWRFSHVKILFDSQYFANGVGSDLPTLTDDGYIYSKTPPTHINRDLWEALAYMVKEANRIQVNIEFCQISRESNACATELSRLGSLNAQPNHNTAQMKPDKGAALQRLLKEKDDRQAVNGMRITYARHGWKGVPRGFKVNWKPKKN